jgi:hypothetical protein
MNRPPPWRFAAWLLLALGALSFLLYPLHELAGMTLTATTTRLVFYSLATFGAAAIPWGLVLLRAAVDPKLQDAMAIPTAVGFTLLAAMRALAVVTGHEVLDMIPVRALRLPATAAEVVLFGYLAYRFWTGAARHA